MVTGPGTSCWSQGASPAVIDWPPYRRPPEWALAVAAVDGVCWDGASSRLLDDWSDVEQWSQLLLRALVYRIATVGHRELSGQSGLTPAEHSTIVKPVLSDVLSRL